MIPINNSDTAWLIVSDYNQDNNIPYEDLREDVLNPETNHWIYLHRYLNVIGPVGISGYVSQGEVGDDDEAGVGGGLCSKTVGFYDENYVGGNPYDPHQ